MANGYQTTTVVFLQTICPYSPPQWFWLRSMVGSVVYQFLRPWGNSFAEDLIFSRLTCRCFVCYALTFAKFATPYFAQHNESLSLIPVYSALSHCTYAQGFENPFNLHIIPRGALNQGFHRKLLLIENQQRQHVNTMELNTRNRSRPNCSPFNSLQFRLLITPRG